MNDLNNTGVYSKKFLSFTPADLQSEEAKYFKNTLPKFYNESIYIFSFRLNKLIYADGWEDVLGYKDNEVSILQITMSTVKEYAIFSNEIDDKAMLFIHNCTENVGEYAITKELKKYHKNGTEVPIISKVRIKTVVDGKMDYLIGRFQVNHSLNFGKIMKFEFHGPEKVEMYNMLNKNIFIHLDITEKEKEVIRLASKGFSLKEIAKEFNVTQSAIEKRLFPLYKRFDLKSLPHLISFAYENNILP